MAWDPCVTCGREFHGSTSFTYVSWHQGETRFAFRLRQCDQCAMDLRNGVMGTADKRDEHDKWQSLTPRRDELEQHQVAERPSPARRNGASKSRSGHDRG